MSRREDILVDPMWLKRLTCCHRFVVHDDEPERYALCLDCGSVSHTRLTRKILERHIKEILEEQT
jgi:hypothetical protein